jgi:hypothetical protein
MLSTKASDFASGNSRSVPQTGRPAALAMRRACASLRRR